MEVVTLLVVAACMAVYVLWFSRLASRLTGPRVWPVVGSLPGLIQHSERMHEWIADNLRVNGGTYQTCICAVPGLARRQGLVTVTCDPRNLEHVLKTRFDNYPKGPTYHAVFLDLLGDGIFNSDGDTWLFQRKTAALEFTTRTLRHAMSRWVCRSIHLRLLPMLQDASLKSGVVDLQELLLRLTFDNICGLAFGKDPETLAPGLPENAFAVAFDRATEATLNRFILPESMWRFKKWLRVGMEATLFRSVAHVDRYLSAVIKTRKLEIDDGQNHDDLLSRFIKKGTYSESFLQHVALNFILAGRDTSSVALSWFFWLVSSHPHVERRILLELASVLHESRGPDTSAWLASPFTFEEVDRLVYLKAALSETLRLYRPYPRTRSTSWPTTSSRRHVRTRWLLRHVLDLLGREDEVSVGTTAWNSGPTGGFRRMGSGSRCRTRSDSWPSMPARGSASEGPRLPPNEVHRRLRAAATPP
ncbi:unnamed protein product [Musa acuminata subsp. burmannicoides]